MLDSFLQPLLRVYHITGSSLATGTGRVCSGLHDKAPGTVRLKEDNYVLTVLEAGSPR